MAKAKTIQEHFGARLRGLRKRADITLDELGHLSGIEPKYVGAIERGEKNLTIVLIGQLADALDVEPAQLFLFDEDGLRAPERMTAAWIMDRLAGLAPEARRLAGSGIALVLQALAEGKKK